MKKNQLKRAFFLFIIFWPLLAVVCLAIGRDFGLLFWVSLLVVCGLGAELLSDEADNS